MLSILPDPATMVKPADAFLDARPELVALAFEPADDHDDSWLMSDAEADALAFDSEADAAVESGHWAF